MRQENEEVGVVWRVLWSRGGSLMGGMAGVLAKLLQGSVGLVGRVLAWRFAIRYLLQPGRIRFAA